LPLGRHGLIWLQNLRELFRPSSIGIPASAYAIYKPVSHIGHPCDGLVMLTCIFLSISRRRSLDCLVSMRLTLRLVFFAASKSPNHADDIMSLAPEPLTDQWFLQVYLPSLAAHPEQQPGEQRNLSCTPA
jgi:hypothetical protein